MKKLIITTFVFLTALLTGCQSGTAKDELLLQKQNASEKRIELGYAYLEIYQYELAKEAFTKAYQHFDGNGRADLALAEYFQLMKDYALTEQHFQKAIEKSQEFAKKVGAKKEDLLIAYKYATFLCDIKDYPKALNYFDKSLKLSNITLRKEMLKKAQHCAEKANEPSYYEKYQKAFKKIKNF
ncbi:MAG: hypothetical protein CR960_00985 [Pasteurellales bacterium]|nr:MAG: hypothetical protein CR960_00985 [Pasteurellales bacterium]